MKTYVVYSEWKDKRYVVVTDFDPKIIVAESIASENDSYHIDDDLFDVEVVALSAQHCLD